MKCIIYALLCNSNLIKNLFFLLFLLLRKVEQNLNLKFFYFCSTFFKSGKDRFNGFAPLFLKVEKVEGFINF